MRLHVRSNGIGKWVSLLRMCTKGSWDQLMGFYLRRLLLKFFWQITLPEGQAILLILLAL